MQKKILITGASGFIGSFMAQHALEEGMDLGGRAPYKFATLSCGQKAALY